MSEQIKRIVKSGNPFLIYHNSENETALVIPAEFMTEAKYRLFREYATSDVAMMFPVDIAESLGIEYISDALFLSAEYDSIVDSAVRKSHAGPTLDLKSVETGSADADKVKTITRFAEVISSQNFTDFFNEFSIPGHVRTYLADQDLLDGRSGHTELGVYLSLYTQLSGVVCMVTIRDKVTGKPFNLIESERFAEKNNYTIFYENDILDLYRREFLPYCKASFEQKQNKIIEDYRKLLDIRKFEQTLEKLFKSQKIRGSYHLAIGQEATGVALGKVISLKEGDSAFVTHRGHHIALGLGLNSRDFFFECIGSEQGLNNGRSGPMHFFYKPNGLISANGIVAANAPIAAGLALSNKLKNNNNVVVNVVGEGSLDEGVVHETLTDMKIWGIPLIILCENNFYSQSTVIEKHLPYERVTTAMRQFYGIKVERIENGTDLIHLQKRLNHIVGWVRKNKMPVFVEIQTYRQCGHSMSDTEQSYMDPSLDSAWLRKDPVSLLKQYILNHNLSNNAALEKIESEVIEFYMNLETQV